MKQRFSKKLVDDLPIKNTAYDVFDEQCPKLMLRVNPKGKKSYYVQLERGKRKKIGDTATMTPLLAREVSNDIMADYLRGIDPTEKQQPTGTTFIEFLDEYYEQDIKVRLKSYPRLIDKLRNTLKPFHNKKLTDITFKEMEQWRNKRKTNGASNATVNRDIVDMKTMLNKAVDAGYLEKNPLSKMKLLKIDQYKMKRFLSKQEQARLIDALNARETTIISKRDSANIWREARGYKVHKTIKSDNYADHLKPMVFIALSTGIRLGELLNLKWQDVDIEKGLLTIQGSGAKSGKSRYIPLHDKAIEAFTTWQKTIVRYKQASDYVFTNPTTGKRFDNVNKAWKAVLKTANVENFRWHDLRHTFASNLVMQGVDINTVRELMGHSDIKMTLVYAHLAPEHKAKAIAKLQF